MANRPAPFTRRDLLASIGIVAGAGTAYRALASLNLVPESSYRGPIKLDGDPRGASVLILGAGLAGMTAAIELRAAGYKVSLLEYNSRPGGRNWTLRGGDRYTELGGATQHCAFDRDLYLNPGPWRLPHHHHAILDYCRRFGVALEPFTQVNYNAYVHAAGAFGGKPQRIRTAFADFRGHVTSLLAQAAHKGALDQAVTREDQELLLEAMRSWGALDKDYAYRGDDISGRFRGWKKDPGGGFDGGRGGAGIAGEPIDFSTLLRSGIWRAFENFSEYDLQTTLFQPVGGMDMVGKAFARQLPGAIRFNARVTNIAQSGEGVTVMWEDVTQPGSHHEAKADWCICTIPLSILSQIPIDVGPKMKAAIGAVPYASSVKVGLQFKRRFWEEDEAIYGGMSFTDLPNALIGYPNHGMNAGGKGVVLGFYCWDTPGSYEFSALEPAERIRRTLELGAQIHPQYHAEFETGMAVAWHRSPFTLGCAGDWTDAARQAHYADLCAIDGRIVLAGEHASYIPAWQEGAILSALDAIGRLHRRVVNA